MGTLKLQSNGPLYSNMVIGMLAVDGGLLHWVQQGGAWVGCCTKCNSPPINGQCTNVILFGMALQLPLRCKGLNTHVSTLITN